MPDVRGWFDDRNAEHRNCASRCGGAALKAMVGRMRRNDSRALIKRDLAMLGGCAS